jgi:hypothetical protein
MIISINAEKAFEKLQPPFIPRYGGVIPQYNKRYI